MMKTTRIVNGRGPINMNSNHGPRSSSGSDRRRSSVEQAGSPSEPIKLGGKSYHDIREQCLRDRRLFEDPDFPATDLSISKRKRPRNPLEWKRPGEITSDPQMFVGGASRLDIQQGNLGDCWLLAATSSLCQYPDLLNKVIPQDQGFTAAEGYCGAFRFNFWTFGEWKEVIVDDNLPTKNGRLAFMHSPEKNEFWAALMEKAYAKMYGSYESLKGGSSSEAMEDFTGGITEVFDLAQQLPANLFDIVMKSVERESMMGCSIDTDSYDGMKIEDSLSNGLIVGHAYSVTDAKAIDTETSRGKSKIQLVRVRNPWGNDCEWKGAWSDRSKEWSMVSARERQRLGLVMSDDGEFWMSFQDFVKNFSKLEICNLGPDSVTEDKSKLRYQMTSHQGSWKKGLNAGGCLNNRNTFWTNPQYRVTVIDADESDDDDKGTLIVALLQKERRSRSDQECELLTIGYTIYKLADPKCGPLDQNFFRRNKSIAKSPQFIDMREVTGRHKLVPGTYCIIPSTFDAGEEGEFLLRVYTEKPIDSVEIDEETKLEERPRLRNLPSQPAVDDETRAKMKRLFRQVAGSDLEIDAYKLQSVLNDMFKEEFSFDGFSDHTCKSLVAMLDRDRSGKLSYEECKKLWYDMRLWEAMFRRHDEDKNGTFNSYELRAAVKEIGVSVSNSTFNCLVQLYSDREGKITFDKYIHCVARLLTMFDIFKTATRDNSTAEFSLEVFISSTMYS